MPKVAVNGSEYFYEEAGSGVPVVFGHSLLFDHHMWDSQVETLSAGYRCIAYDFPGHGGSSLSGGEYSLEDEAMNPHFLKHLERVAWDTSNGFFGGVTDVVEKVGGRMPKSLETFVRENIAAFGGAQG